MINDTVRTRLPIYCSLLETILFEVERHFKEQPYLSVLYKSLFALGYYGLLRVGELTSGNHTIKAKDIHIGRTRIRFSLCYILQKPMIWEQGHKK